jgi:hypothetical protein
MRWLLKSLLSALNDLLTFLRIVFIVSSKIDVGKALGQGDRFTDHGIQLTHRTDRRFIVQSMPSTKVIWPVNDTDMDVTTCRSL